MLQLDNIFIFRSGYISLDGLVLLLLGCYIISKSF